MLGLLDRQYARTKPNAREGEESAVREDSLCAGWGSAPEAENRMLGGFCITHPGFAAHLSGQRHDPCFPLTACHKVRQRHSFGSASLLPPWATKARAKSSRARAQLAFNDQEKFMSLRVGHISHVTMASPGTGLVNRDRSHHRPRVS